MTARQAESLLLKAGFVLIRTKGNHRIYKKDNDRAVVPYHGNSDLHPKIIKEILEIISK